MRKLSARPGRPTNIAFIGVSKIRPGCGDPSGLCFEPTGRFVMNWRTGFVHYCLRLNSNKKEPRPCQAYVFLRFLLTSRQNFTTLQKCHKIPRKVQRWRVNEEDCSLRRGRVFLHSRRSCSCPASSVHQYQLCQCPLRSRSDCSSSS